MAKKVAVPNEDIVEKNGGVNKKKKRNCCCTCCLVVVIVMLVLFLGAFITGWILGDKYTKKLFGLSMGDTLGVVSDLYWTDDSDVVTRPFTKKDLNGFYSEIKRNILLKDDADIDFGSALDAAVEKYFNADKADALNASGAEADGADQNKETDSEITDIFVDMIVGVLNRENIDIERLNSYPEKDEYIFNLTDKQLAAFVNVVLKSVLKNALQMDDLKEISAMVQLDKVVALKQIRFTVKSGKGEDGKTEVKASSAEITVWIGLQDAANQAIKKFLRDQKQAWAGGIVGWLGDVILPENLYITVSVPLYGDGNKASVKINDMNSNERARANKLINGIIKLVVDDDNAKTLDDVIDELVGKIKPSLEEAAEHMDFTAAGKGTISIDLLETVAGIASKDMAEGEKLTKADFLYVLQALFSDKTEQLNALTPYRYDNWYMVDGVVTYMPTGGDPANKIDYEHQFIEQIENKYAIDFGENKNLSEILDMLGISLDGSNNANAGSTDLLDRMNSERFKALLDENIDDIKLNITDRMLGSALSGQMDKILLKADLQKLDMTLDALTFVKKTDPEKSNHLYALLAVEVDVSGLLGDAVGDQNSMVSKLVTGLMPDSILLTVTVDITRDRSVTRDQAEFMINSCANTDRVLATLERLVPDIKLNEISGNISATLNDMLDQMDSKLEGVRLAASTYVYNEELNGWLGNSGGITMPDIFSFIADMVLVDEGGNKVVTSEQIQHVIRDLNNPATIQAVQPSGYADFIGDVFDKYYLNDPEEAVEDFDALTEYMSEFKTDMLRVHGTDGLAHDDRAMSTLKPIMKGDELLALLSDKMGGNEAIKSYNIVKVEIGDNTLAITLCIELSDLLTDAEQVRKLISANRLYATATFHTDRITGDGTDGNPYGYGVELAVNVSKHGENDVMDGDTYGAMLNIVKLFKNDFDIEKQVKEFGVILYEQMQSLNTSMGGSDDRTLFSFTSRGLELTDFYTFLALKMKPDLLDRHSNEDIRRTVQGLYSYDEAAQNANNFKISDIMFNPPSSETDPHVKPNGSTAWTDEEAITLYGNTHVDVDFNGFLKRGVESMSNSNDIKVEQTMILAKGDDRTQVQTVRDWLNLKLALKAGDPDYVAVDNDYLAVTFSMAMGSFAGDEQGSNDAESMFPDKIYATVVYLYDSAAPDGTDKFSIVGDDRKVGPDGSEAPLLVFNNMADVEYDIMVTMMGVNPDATDESKVNIISIIQQGKTVLNDMTHFEREIGGIKVKVNTTITFYKTSDTENGMGKVNISNGTVQS